MTASTTIAIRARRSAGRRRAGAIASVTTLVIGLTAASLGTACARDQPRDPARAVAALPAVHDAWLRPGVVGRDAALYFTLVNPGPDSIVLVAVTTAVAAATSLHTSMQMGAGAGAMVHMTPLLRVAVAPTDSVRFAPLGRHAMLERLQRPLAVGDSVPFALAITRAGRPDTLRARAAVRPY